MIRQAILCALALFVLFAAPAARADTSGANAVIGTVLEVQGQVTVTDATGSRAAALNSDIHMNDVVTTGPASHVYILLIDNTQWTLAENSKFRVDDFVFDQNDKADNMARYSVLQGAFNYVSGLVAKKANPDVNIATPVGSIGIRGTDFWGGPIDGQYGVMVNEGRVDLTTQAGAVSVAQGQGTTVANRYSKPGRAGAWSPERMAKIKNTVNLKYKPQIMALKQRVQERLMQLRQKLVAHQAQRRAQMQQKREQRREQMQQKRQQHQEKMEQNREERQEKMEQKREQRQERMQEKRKERQQGRRDGTAAPYGADDADNDANDTASGAIAPQDGGGSDGSSPVQQAAQQPAQQQWRKAAVQRRAHRNQ